MCELLANVCFNVFFIAQHTDTTRDIAIAILSVCPSVCQLRSGILWKQLTTILS